MDVLETTLFGPEAATIIILAGLAAAIAYLTRRPAALLFLATGMIAGPLTGLVSASATAELLSEFGLIFLLFLIGLDITVERIRPLLRDTLWISPAQMIVTFLVFTGLTGLYFPTTTAVIIGIAMTYSSTAVVLTMLEDRGESDTTTGRLNMSILLFEDIAVILIIAGITAGGATTALASAAVTALGSLAVLLVSAFLLTRYILPFLLSRSYDHPHTYFVEAIGVLFLFLGISELLGISLEIGAFFAGITLAQLPGHEELHERIRPLTSLFMALFFIGLSLQLSRSDLLVHADIALLIAGAVLIEKLIVHLGLFTMAGYTKDIVVRGSINMTQTSEFSLVLGATALSAGLIGQEILGLLALVALTTMMISTILIDEQDRVLELLGIEDQQSHSETDAVIIGFGQDGASILGLLQAQYDDITVVDPRLETAQTLRDTDVRHVFAEIGHEAIKRESGFYTADIIVGIDTPAEEGLELLNADPDGTVVLIADDIETADAFQEAGADHVIDREDLSIQHLNSIIGQMRGETGE